MTVIDDDETYVWEAVTIVLLFLGWRHCCVCTLQAPKQSAGGDDERDADDEDDFELDDDDDDEDDDE